MKYIKLYEDIDSNNPQGPSSQDTPDTFPDLSEKIKQLRKYLQVNPHNRYTIMSELEGIKDGLDNKGRWIDEKGKEDYDDYYQLWMHHYKGFTKSEMETIIRAVQPNEDFEKIIRVVSDYLKQNPDEKRRLIDKIHSLR